MGLHFRMFSLASACFEWNCANSELCERVSGYENRRQVNFECLERRLRVVFYKIRQSVTNPSRWLDVARVGTVRAGMS